VRKRLVNMHDKAFGVGEGGSYSAKFAKLRDSGKRRHIL